MIEQFYDLRPDVLELDRKALELCREPFRHVEEIRDYNQLKMLRAFTDCGVEARHFWGSSGYGVWDDSRNKLEEVFARCMGAEAALVRSQFMSGTHTLTVALFGLLPAIPCWPRPAAPMIRWKVLSASAKLARAAALCASTA